MSTGYNASTTAMKNPDILSFGHRLPDSLNVVSILNGGEWFTQVNFGGSHRIRGIVVQSVYDSGTLSLGINDRLVNAVYRFTEEGEDGINRFSESLTQHCDIGLYICPFKPRRTLLHHGFLHKTLPVVSEVTRIGSGYEVDFVGLCEHTEINCSDKSVLCQTGVSEYYRAVLDPVNNLSTLFRREKTGDRVLSVTDTLSGMPIYTPKGL